MNSNSSLSIILDSPPVSLNIQKILAIICVLFVLIRNIIGCKGHIGYILLYTVVQLFVGFTIGLFGIATLLIAVFVIAAGTWIGNAKAEYYPIILYNTADSFDRIAARIDPHNSDRLLGENGEIFESNGAGDYSVVFSPDSSDLCKTYRR